jgi:hypothetical protein
MSARRKAAVTFGVSLALLAILAAVTLAHAPPRVLREGTKQKAPFAIEHGDVNVCQGGEALPSGVSAIRLSVWAFFGTPVHVRVYSGPRLLTEGGKGAGWTGSTVTVPITPLHRSVSPVTVCARLGPNNELIYLLGAPARPPSSALVGGRPTEGRMGIEYLAAGQGSWWSRIVQVSRHMGLGHALTGTWVVLLIFALMAAVGGLAIRLGVEELS